MHQRADLIRRTARLRPRSQAAIPVWISLLALVLAMLPGAAYAAPVIDGTLSAGEWSGYEITTGTDNVVPGSYDLSAVYAQADSEALYMAFETVGAGTGGAVLALNVGANRALTTSPTATLGENGAWSFSMELFNFTSGAFATADSKYKYNDAGVDYAGSPQSRDMPAADLVTQGQFTAAYSQVGNTQTIEYAIELDALETAFGRTYQDSVISVGDELLIVGFLNQAGGWAPISFPDGGPFGPSFGDQNGYAPVTISGSGGGAITPEPSTFLLTALGLLGLAAGRRRRAGFRPGARS